MRSVNEPCSGGGQAQLEFNREAGLAKAMRLFWTFGYESASMADLRAALGITQASLYAAYRSKEELFREAVGLYQRTSGSTTSHALAVGASARESIHAVLSDAVDAFTKSGAPGGCLVVLGTINCTPENKPIQEHLLSLRRQTLHGILERLKRGQREGEIPIDAPIAAIAAYYTTVLHGLSIQARDGDSRKALMQVVECAMATWATLLPH